METLGTTGIMELKEELDGVRENFAAHMLLALCPDVNTNVLNFVGRQRTITTSEVMEYVERNSSLTHVNTISSFPTAATATETAMPGSKPRNKRFNSRKTRTCVVCGQEYMLSQYPTLKRLVPNAPVFKSRGNKSKNIAWIGCQDITSDGTVNDSSDFGCVATDFPLSKKDWVYDSGCTTHVCCDRSMFSTFMPAESSIISGIAGSAPILGYGRVEMEEITLNNVAYVPSMSFNLISIKRASVIANVRFIFDQNSLSVIYPSNKVKQLGMVRMSYMCWIGLIYGTTEKSHTLGVRFPLTLPMLSTIPCYHGEGILCQLRLNSTKVYFHWKDPIRPSTQTGFPQRIPLPKQKRQITSIIVSDGCSPLGNMSRSIA